MTKDSDRQPPEVSEGNSHKCNVKFEVVSPSFPKSTSTPLQTDDDPSGRRKPKSPPPIATKNDTNKEGSTPKVKLEDDTSVTSSASFARTMDPNVLATSPAMLMPQDFTVHPSRKLSFEDEQPFSIVTTPKQNRVRFDDDEARDFSTGSHLLCPETQEVVCPTPVALDGFFPSSALEDIGSFHPFQGQQFQIDDSYCSNLLGSAFIPSPNESGVSSSHAAQFQPLLANIHDIRVQYNVPPLSSSKVIMESSQCPPFLVQSLPKLDGDGYNEEVQGESEECTRKRTIGKTIDNLNQISASATKRKKSAKPQTRKVTRNLPLRKRHTKVEPEEVLTTPMAATRPQTRHMVSRSASVEKTKKESTSQSRTSRNRSKRQSKTSVPRTASTSDARFKDESPSIGVGTMRIIQHFTPKRNTVAILSTETSLPKTVVFG